MTDPQPHSSQADPRTHQPDSAEPSPTPHPVHHAPEAVANPLARFYHWLRAKPVRLALASAIAVVVVASATTAATQLRYPVLGLLWRPPAQVTITDATTHQPLGKVKIELAGQTAFTNTQGIARLPHVHPGHTTLRVTKDGYDSLSRTDLVPFLSHYHPTLTLKPNGIKVVVQVTNSLTAAAVAGVSVAVGDSSILTDATGRAELSLPPALDHTRQTLRFKKDGYNDRTADILVSVNAKTTTAQLLPAGKVYFLSNRTGRIDLHQANLDGSSDQLVLAGTGKETTDTGLLSSIKHPNLLALVSSRDGQHSDGSGDLFIFNADNRQLRKVDSEISFYNYRAWTDDTLVYLRYSTNTATIKTYNVATSKTTDLTSITFKPGTYGSLYVNAIYGNTLIYSINGDDDHHGLYAVNVAKNTSHQLGPNPANQISRSDLKTLQIQYNTYYNPYLPKPNVWQSLNLDNFVLADLGDGPSILSYRSYVDSPGGKYTCFIEQRDGKSDLYLTDSQGANERRLTTDGGVNQFVQWYGDDYIVFSKGSTLYVAATASTLKPVKVADFYAGNGRTYGGGYNPNYYAD